jgi:glycerophosphoryl diester phosphodiesterase
LTLTKEWLNRFAWPTSLLTGHPLAVAHRGASDHAPENTLKAFQIAANLSAEMWELDIRLSADGVCVVVHDEDLTRIAERPLRVSDAQWQELCSIALAEGQYIPRLEQVIELARQTGCGLYIEIKSAGAGPLAWRLLQRANFRFACLASFNLNWIKELRKLGCEYPLGVLVPGHTDPLACINGVSVDIVHLCWRNASENPHELLTDSLLQSLRDRDKQVVLWHEERSHVLDAILKKPIMGICSNRPEVLKPYKQSAKHQIDIVCHRGANNIAPENTLEAARICIDQHFQYVELDVRTTADGELVVVHDENLQRTTNGSGLVSEHTLTEINELDAGSWFREQAAGVRVPTLAQFLAFVYQRSGVYIELKHANPDAVLKIVTKYNMLKNCFFWSADTDALHWLHRKNPELVLMAPRNLYKSVAEAAAAYKARIIEFDVETDELAEIADCSALNLRSMIYSRRPGQGELASYLEYKPDMLNLDHPEQYKILSTYPLVLQHFNSIQEAGTGGE